MREELRQIYDDLARDISRAGPVCDLSGRCCRFQEYDHTLFLSGVEAAMLVDEAASPVRPLDSGATCPWQDGRGRCTARDARPLGCRVYYCDPSYQDEASRLSELFIARLKRLVDLAGLAWDYAPLHVHLRQARDARRIEFPEAISGEPTQ